jgi:hypothetical protein
MKRLRTLMLAALLAIAGSAVAQLKPSGPGTTPLPPSTSELQRVEAQGIKELAARVAAEKWLALLDAGEYGKAWDASAKMFRERVPREQWLENLPKTRGVHGKLKSRRAEVSSWKPSLPGVPQGDYVTVRFSSSFDNKSDAEELITLVLEEGIWRPLGYGLR